ncbi:hypothetical protein IG631_00354 [Alternaria alternata]|nr:hypothetical protein IG631_00354 [Alternaria alternata]
MSKDQKLRLAWCFCHLVVAGLVQWGAHESLALTVLSRLIFYDALGAFLCVAVDVGSNFEVWKRSSIRHPFGFERLEVIAGLGMSVGLLFMGLDLISHGLTHALENTGGHEAHHADAHERVSAGSIDLAALCGVVSTLVSAILLKNHARIGKVMRLSAIANLPSVLSNPSHFLTLSCSSLLLILPLLSIQICLLHGGARMDSRMDPRQDAAHVLLGTRRVGHHVRPGDGPSRANGRGGKILAGTLRALPGEPETSSEEFGGNWASARSHWQHGAEPLGRRIRERRAEMGNFDPNYTREGLRTLGAVACPRLDSAINLPAPVAGRLPKTLTKTQLQPERWPKSSATP